MIKIESNPESVGKLKVGTSAATPAAGELTVGSNIIAGSGAVGTPAFTFNGDTDTGIYRSAANSLGIATAGTARIVVAADGAVTLNNFTLPTAIGSSGQILKVPSSGSVLEWGDASGGSGIDGSGTAKFLPMFSDADTLTDSGFQRSPTSATRYTLNSPATFTTHGELTVFGTIAAADAVAKISLVGTVMGKTWQAVSNAGDYVLSQITDGGETYRAKAGSSGHHMFHANGSIRLGIDRSGNVLYGPAASRYWWGATVVPDASNDGLVINGTSGGNRSSSGSSTSAYSHWVFYNNNGAIGSISTSGSTTTFSTSSDVRLKENLTPLTGALDRIEQLPVYRFNFKADPEKTVDGFLAHEAAIIVPEAVTGEKDGTKTVVVQEGKEEVEGREAVFWKPEDELPEGVVAGDVKIAGVEAQEYQEEITEEQPDYQGIDQSKLLPVLWAAVRELKSKVEALENA